MWKKPARKKEKTPIGFELLCVRAELCLIFPAFSFDVTWCQQNNSVSHLGLASVFIALYLYCTSQARYSERSEQHCTLISFLLTTPDFPHHIRHVKTHTFDLQFVFYAPFCYESHGRLAFIILSHLQYFRPSDAHVPLSCHCTC